MRIEASGPDCYSPPMPDATAPALSPAPPSKLKVFARRLTSFVILWTIVLVALFCGKKWVSDNVFLLIMVFLATTGLAEF